LYLIIKGTMKFTILLWAVFALHGFSEINFELPDLKGETYSLKDYRGKIVVIDYWAVWCVTCRHVFPVLNELQKKYSPEKVQVIGISIDKQPSSYVKKFVKTAKIKYTILHDSKDQTSKLFDLKAIPTMFILDETGKITLTILGYNKKEKKKLFDHIDKLVGKLKKTAKPEPVPDPPP